MALTSNVILPQEHSNCKNRSARNCGKSRSTVRTVRPRTKTSMFDMLVWLQPTQIRRPVVEAECRQGRATRSSQPTYRRCIRADHHFACTVFTEDTVLSLERCNFLAELGNGIILLVVLRSFCLRSSRRTRFKVGHHCLVVLEGLGRVR